jgi:hypothetical protein
VRACFDVTELERVGGGEGGEGARGQRSGGGDGLRDAVRRVGCAAPREVLLFARGRVVQRRVEVFRFFAFCAFGRLDQARQRRRVVAGGGDDGGYEFGTQQR